MSKKIFLGCSIILWISWFRVGLCFDDKSEKNIKEEIIWQVEKNDIKTVALFWVYKQPYYSSFLARPINSRNDLKRSELAKNRTTSWLVKCGNKYEIIEGGAIYQQQQASDSIFQEIKRIGNSICVDAVIVGWVEKFTQDWFFSEIAQVYICFIDTKTSKIIWAGIINFYL